MTRNATALWSGTGKDGNGTISTQSTVLNGTQYSYKSRFEDGVGTNPEELIAAAHAGCFTMKLSFGLQEAGFAADQLETRCDITLDGGKITTSKLSLKGKVPNIEKEQFEKIAQEAKEGCPVSMVLNAEISLTVELL